jgi:hypothetical protein
MSENFHQPYEIKMNLRRRKATPQVVREIQTTNPNDKSRL